MFKPHIPCDDKKRNKNSVGKVFEYPETMESEQSFLEIMRTIDPHGEFTLPYQGSCTTVSTFRKNDQIEMCSFIHPGYRYQQLLIPYGGKSLKEWMMSKKGTFNTFMKMMQRMKPILEGLQRMKDMFGYVHQDIKPDNILFHKGKLYLIDFSLMTKVNEIYSESNEGVLQSSYPYFPPEYKYYVHKPRSLKAYSQIVKPSYKYVTMVHDGEHDFWYLFDMVGINPASELDDFLKNKVLSSHYAQRFAPTVDIFSLGIVLALMYQWCGMDKIVYRRASKKYALHNRVLALLRSMLTLNPYNRVTYSELLDEYNSIFQSA